MPKLETGFRALVMDGLHHFLQRGNVLVAPYAKAARIFSLLGDCMHFKHD